MRKLVAALAVAVAVPAAVTVAAEAQAANYIVYLHGRGWSSWNGETANVAGWTNVTFSYNGSARINGPETNSTVKNAIASYCGAGNSCVVHCYSAGCYRMLKAVNDLRASGNTVPGLLWVEASASAAGGTKLAEVSTKGLTGFLAKLLGQQEQVDFDLTPAVARNTYGYIQGSAGAIVYHAAGNKDICKSFLWGAVKLCSNKYIDGRADGAVGFDSSSGASAQGSYSDGCATTKYPYRTYDARSACGGEGRDHFGMPGFGSATIANVLGGWSSDQGRNWSDDTTGMPDCNDANGECDGAFTYASQNYSATTGGTPVAGSVASSASNTTGSTAGKTCAGKCGKNTGQGCFCDSMCSFYHDCCTDYFAAKCDVINNMTTGGPGKTETYIGETPDWGFGDRRWVADWNGDRKADYCRAVGNTSGAGSYMMCSLSTGTGRSDAYVAAIGDWGFGDRRWMTDWNGDGKADYCRAVGNSSGSGSYMLCSLSTGTGASDAYVATIGDWGYGDRRWMIDWNGDGKKDLCRAVGNTSGSGSYLLCSLSTGTGSQDAYVATVPDWGYADRRWMIDWNGDGKIDFCRATGNSSGSGSYLQCSLSTGTGAQDIWVPIGDWGYDDRRWMADWNGDGKIDFCRAVGQPSGPGSYLQCAFSNGNGANDMMVGEIQDWGYGDRRWMIDWNGDGKADFCRATGNTSGSGSYLSCALSTGISRQLTNVGELTDWGYGDRRWMADWNGDGKVDFLRAVGNTSGSGSWLLGAIANAPNG